MNDAVRMDKLTRLKDLPDNFLRLKEFSLNRN
jgi:hypothetical protein